MKSGLTVVLFRLFTIGVFVGGKESNGELVSVTEGDSVTLMSGVTKIGTDDKIKWEFDGSPLATISIDSGKLSEWIKSDGPFGNRLQLNNQTGDLKISNIKTTDSGLYKVKISSPDGSPEMTFNVSVVSADEVKLVSVSVNVGDSVTLRPDPTYIQGYDVIRWRFGQQKSLVAEINRTAGIFNTYNGPDERFRDRLKLNNQTGSLIITNTRTTDSGLYEVEINSGKHTIHKSFSVTVSGSGLQSGSGVVAWIIAVVLLVAAVAVLVGVVVYQYCKISELKSQREENEVNRNTQKTDDHATEETKLATDS